MPFGPFRIHKILTPNLKKEKLGNMKIQVKQAEVILGLSFIT
jgi:hypothetical protein